LHATIVGGCFVEGEWLRNAFRWRESIGPWEERPGHFGDVWHYWTDDGLGYYEFLQVPVYTTSIYLFFLSHHHPLTITLKSTSKLAEDLGAAPIWVFNNGNCFQIC
jgi:alpha-N-arabinofuranosidase